MSPSPFWQHFLTSISPSSTWLLRSVFMLTVPLRCPGTTKTSLFLLQNCARGGFVVSYMFTWPWWHFRLCVAFGCFNCDVNRIYCDRNSRSMRNFLKLFTNCDRQFSESCHHVPPAMTDNVISYPHSVRKVTHGYFNGRHNSDFKERWRVYHLLGYDAV
jgi:hypothetical protein